jgi:hypothetical protein
MFSYLYLSPTQKTIIMGGHCTGSERFAKVTLHLMVKDQSMKAKAYELHK